MHVVSVAISLLQYFFSREVRENAQLDLRRLTSIAFVFDQVHGGEVSIDQIGFSELDPGFLGARADGVSPN